MRWIRCIAASGQPVYAHVDGDHAQPVEGTPFGEWADHGEPLALDAVQWLPPVQPSKVIALWKNFHALAAKQQQTIPEEPLYALRAPSSLAAHQQAVVKPASYDGAVFYEGELALVVGRTMRSVPPEAVREHLLGCTIANDVTAIEVYTVNPDKIDVYRKSVTEAAQRPIFLVDWRQRNSTFFNALQVERNVMFLILTLIVLVAALNIVSGLIMLVKDKGQDIAILRTMGASQGSVMRVFLITGAAIGVVGTLVGFLLGLLVCLNIESIRQFISWLTNTELFSPELYFLSKLPAEVDVGETTAVVIMALTLSFLATLYPSWRAARLDPIEALRYE